MLVAYPMLWCTQTAIFARAAEAIEARDAIEVIEAIEATNKNKQMHKGDLKKGGFKLY
jgi:hypothetical protein